MKGSDPVHRGREIAGDEEAVPAGCAQNRQLFDAAAGQHEQGPAPCALGCQDVGLGVADQDAGGQVSATV
jgi:hypothetical protein